MRPDEQLDILLNGRQIIQDKKRFMFGIDAVLLSDFASSSIKKNDRVIDLGTGTGIIPLLLETLSPAHDFTALEIQSDSADMARRSMEANGLSDLIHIVEGDIKEVSSIFTKHSFNVVTCNPPYMNDSHGRQNESEAKNIARHEICCNLEDVIVAADYLLAPHGRFFMIHRPYRLPEIFALLAKYNLEAKVMQLVIPSKGKEPNLVMIEARKNAQPRLKIAPQFAVYGEDGEYSSEVKAVYERQKASARKITES